MADPNYLEIFTSQEQILNDQATTRSASKRSSSSSPYDRARRNHKRPRRAPKDLRTSQSTTKTNVRSSAQACTIFTIGHGTRSLQDLTGILQTANVSVLVDIRSFPRSRTNPQFNHSELSSALFFKETGICYKWMGESLGGRRNARQPNISQHAALRVAAFRNYAGYMNTNPFRRGLEELEMLRKDEAVRGGMIAIMCSETLWWRCHRRMVADKLVTEGWTVRHLGIKKGESPKHELWDVARVGDDAQIVYDRND